jgi:hypothetical protein
VNQCQHTHKCITCGTPHPCDLPECLPLNMMPFKDCHDCGPRFRSDGLSRLSPRQRVSNRVAPKPAAS